MKLREGIFQALQANANLVALVADRISATLADHNQDDECWVAFTKIMGGEEGDMQGDAGLTHPTFQFTVGGTNKEKVDEAARILVDEFNGFEFTYTEDGNDFVLLFLHKDDRDGEVGAATRYFEASVDLEVWANKQPEGA